MKKVNIIPKKAMDGIEVSFDLNAQNFASAYKGNPQSTICRARFQGGLWYVTDIRRDDCRRENRAVRVEHTEASRAALIERFSVFGR